MIVCSLCFLVKEIQNNFKLSIHPTNLHQHLSPKTNIKQSETRYQFIWPSLISWENEIFIKIPTWRKDHWVQKLLSKEGSFFISIDNFFSHIEPSCVICTCIFKVNPMNLTEPLKNRAFTQYRALYYHKNKGGKINLSFFPKICITYNKAWGKPQTPEREEEVQTPFVTESFYWKSIFYPLSPSHNTNPFQLSKNKKVVS